MSSQFVRTLALLLVAAVLIVLFAALFTVHQTQQALVLRFGAVRKVLTDPGLYIKAPLIETVVYVDKRILDLDLPVDRAEQRRPQRS